jgi:hypothetical protein
VDPDPSLRLELMALAAVLGETRPGFQKYGHKRLIQLYELTADLRRIATEIEEGLSDQQHAAQRLAERRNGHRNGNGRLNNGNGRDDESGA